MSASIGNDTFTGSNGNDVMDLLAGNDSYLGLGGDDSILGNDGTDTIDGGNGDDTVAGGNSDDRLIGGNGADFLDGGAGSLDTADYSGNSTAQGVSVNLASGRAADGFGFTDTLASIEFIRGGAGADTVLGGNANDRFRGNAGNDSFDGGNGSEDILDLSQTSRSVSANLVTGVANDGLDGTDRFTNVEVVYSGTASDTLLGSDRNEIFDGGMSGDLIDGGLGIDRVRYYLVSGNNGSITRGVSVDLAAQRATDGWGGADTLVGIDRVTATNFADTLLGDNISNRFNGLAGNDSFDGGLGGDFLEYSNSSATAGVSVNLTTGVASDGTGGVDVFTSIENVNGERFGDHLTGIAQLGRTTSYLTGLAGSDTLVGIEGEFVAAGYTDQTMALSVNLASGSVNDGLGGVDVLINIRGAGMGSGNFADTVIGSNGNDWLSPGGGNDTIIGGDGFDILSYGGSTADGVSVNLATGLARDDNGGIDDFTGIEGVATGYSNDTVIGSSQGNLIALSAGADSADAAGGQDTISYSLGFSPFGRGVIINEAGDQSLFAGVTINMAAGRATDQTGGTDTILNFEAAIGSTMHDSILGSSGNEMFDGAERNDTINAGGGDDTIIGGDGNDLLMGGAGNDLYLMAAATGRVIIDDASGNDTVDFGGVAGREIFTSDISSMAGIEAFDLVGSGNTLHLTAARALSVSGTGLFRVFGGGADMLVFDDTGWLRTGSSGGFDTLSNSAGNATVIASSGIVLSEPGTVVNGGDGNDTLAGGNGADTIDGGNGSDLLAGLSGSDSILGGSGDDSIDGGNGADTISGGIGNDRLQGGAGNDSLSGGDGDDTLNGGGEDTLMGDAGNDLYVAGSTSLPLRINDSGGSDTLSFQGATGGSISAAALGSVNGIEAINLAGGGNTLNLSANRVAALSDTDVLRVFGSGSDRLVFDDAAFWTGGTPSAGFVTFTNGSATVIAAESLVSVVSGPTAGNDSLTGTAGNDTIDLLAGSDRYLGLDGNDVIQGNDGADTIYGGNGADSIAGGNDNDLIFGEAGSDMIDAGAGTSDRISYNLTGGQAITATINSSGGSAGINTATVSTATQGTDSIQGFELLSGSVDGDLITVTTAATQNTNLFLFGSVGNDTIIDNYRQTGVVFADYSSTSTGLSSGVSVDLTSGIATDGFGGTDSLVGITAVNGTSLADTMLGSASNDRFRSLQGNDLMDGRGGTGDIADYSPNSASQAVSVNLATGRANDGLGGTDTLINIEQARGGAGNDVLIGDSNNNAFRGTGGNDTIDGAGGTGDAADYGFATAAVFVNLGTGQAQDGQGGVDSLAGIEVILGSAFADTLIGGNGNDNLRGSAGNDTLDGGAGTADVAQYTSATTGITVNLDTGIVQDGQGGTDNLISIERIWGGSFNDSMLGGNGNDFFVGSTGADTFDGGLGDDAVSYSSYPSASSSPTQGVSVDLATGTARDAFGGLDRLFGIEIVEGSSFADTITGGDANEIIRGNGGADSLTGGAGNDQIYAFGPSDVARLDGGTGNDLLQGSAANDTMSGGDDSDTLYGNGGTDSLSGGNGNDELSGSNGAETILGGNGADSLYGNGGADSLIGDAGDDLLNGSAANETMLGGDDADTLYGNGGNNSLDGGNGDDQVYASGASNMLGGEGNDQLFGSNAADTILGDNGADSIYGNGGADSLSGGAGNDQIYAFGSSDVARLDGGAGNDLLQGSAANDTMSGGDDADTLYGNGGADSLIGGNGSDYLYAFGTVAVTLAGGAGNDELAGATGNDTLDGGDGADTLYGQGGADSFSGGAGADQLYAANGADTMDGGIGNDSLYGNGGSDSLSGGEGDDEISAFGFADAVRFDGGAGNDRMYGGSGADTMAGGDDADTLYGNGGNDSLDGGNGDDQVHASGASNMLGGEGNDQLFGSNAADTILGDNGADSIYGNGGADSLSGGAGNDVAIYSDARTAYRFSLDDGALIVSGPTGTDRLQGIESLRFGSDAPIEVTSLGSMNLIEEMVVVSRGGVTTAVFAERYSGPVSWLEYQVLGIDGGDVMIGTSRNDFFNLLGGDDAVNGGGGDDVLDGGFGSNFLTGGTGRDDFFLDGRGGTVTWATITDWQANERLSVWGWRPGVSTAQWVDSAGATGYTGVTMHGDLDGNGVIDTSVTWTGMTAAQLPTPLEYEGLLWFT